MDSLSDESKSMLEHVNIHSPIGETMRPRNKSIDQRNSVPKKGVVDGLSDFTNLLSNTLGGMDVNINNLQDSYASAMELIQNVQIQMNKQDENIKLLKKETEDQRSKIENALSHVVKIERSVDSQLSESTKQLHKEMVHQRTTTKMDLNSLKGKLTSSMSEAMSMFSEMPKYAQNLATHNPNSTTKESIDFLLEKIKNLEEAQTLQHSVNNILSTSISDASGSMIQKVYDSLFEQVTDLENQLAESKGENKMLREKYNNNFKELREQTRRQEKLIEELTGAITSKNKMKRFKIEISKHHAAPDSNHHRESIAVTSDAPTAIDATDVNQEEGGGGEVRKRHKTTRQSTRVSRRQSKREREREEEEEGSDESGDDDDADERPRHKTTIVKPRESFRPKRMTRLTPRTSVANTSDKPDPLAGPVDPHASTVLTDDDTLATNPPSMIRRNSASKTPNLASIVEPSEEIKDKERKPKRSLRGSKRLNRRSLQDNDPGNYHSLSNIRESNEEDVEDDDGEHSYGEGDEDSYSGEENYSAEDSMFDSDTQGSFLSREANIEMFNEIANKMVSEVKAGYEDRISELENTIVTLKRITYVIDDLKINYDSMHSKFQEILSIKDDSIDEKLDASKFAQLAALKNLWHKVLVEMLFGLENLNDDDHDKGSEHNSVHTGSSLDRDNRGFFAKAADLVALLETAMDDFEPRDTLRLTLVKLHPSLDKIYKQALTLIKMDRAARQSDALDFSFDDILCSDLTPNLKRYVEEAASATVYILDETIAKIGLQLRLDHLESLVDKKADAQTMTTLNAELRAMLKNKIDTTEFALSISRLASLSDVQALRKNILESGNNHTQNATNQHKLGYGSQNGDGSEGMDVKNLMSSPDFQDLLGRFDVLATQFTDVQAFCKTYVPREEVHEAMKAVISEVKLIKKNYVPSNVFKEGLKMKADTEEVDKLIKALSNAIGDLNLQHTSAQGANISINLNDVSGSAAAMHQKCLICDKPVTSQKPRTAKAMKGNALAVSRSTSQIGYDKADEAFPPATASNSNLFNRLTSPDPRVSKKERAKIQSEIAIVRSSIDPLPDISDSMSEYSPRNAGQTTGNANFNGSSSYKQRIRSSAGGGVGPSYKMDTR